jgi:hypothetical protein
MLCYASGRIQLRSLDCRAVDGRNWDKLTGNVGLVLSQRDGFPAPQKISTLFSESLIAVAFGGLPAARFALFRF